MPLVICEGEYVDAAHRIHKRVARAIMQENGFGLRVVLVPSGEGIHHNTLRYVTLQYIQVSKKNENGEGEGGRGDCYANYIHVLVFLPCGRRTLHMTLLPEKGKLWRGYFEPPERRENGAE